VAVQSLAAECCGADTPLPSLVERVEKPTDNRPPARMLCSHVADADSLGDRPVVGPGASPIPLPRRGQCYFGGSPKSHAESFMCGTIRAETPRLGKKHRAEDDIIGDHEPPEWPLRTAGEPLSALSCAQHHGTGESARAVVAAIRQGETPVDMPSENATPAQGLSSACRATSTASACCASASSQVEHRSWYLS
jgi:hypothetical protein